MKHNDTKHEVKKNTAEKTIRSETLQYCFTKITFVVHIYVGLLEIVENQPVWIVLLRVDTLEGPLMMGKAFLQKLRIARFKTMHLDANET